MFFKPPEYTRTHSSYIHTLTHINMDLTIESEREREGDEVRVGGGKFEIEREYGGWERNTIGSRSPINFISLSLS